MNKKETILTLYFEKNLTQEEIAKELSVSQSYVSQVVSSDPRLANKKEISTNNSIQKKKDYNQKYWQNYHRKKSTIKDDYEAFKSVLDNDAKELSSSNNVISDVAFAQWNNSAYHTNNKGNLELNKNLNVTYDVPKTVSMKKKVPTQKYKHRCYSL